MFEVGVQREFIAQHYLIGGDWGDENKPHSHHFKLEIRLFGEKLDEHQYLFDISILEKRLAQIVSYFSDKLLNDLPEFNQKNPSVELFCQGILTHILNDFDEKDMQKLKITLWEDTAAWVSYEHTFH